MNPVLQYWYFHVPNFVLAAVMYSVVGRLALSLFVAADWKNYIWQALVKVTEPAVKCARFLSPAGVPSIIVLVFTVLWLMLLRIGFFMIMGAYGLLPAVGASS
jgi:uncharacterized protein YggT (Ycf19 family)